MSARKRAFEADWPAILANAVSTPGVISRAYSTFWNYSVGNQISALFQCMLRRLEPGPIHTYRGWLELGLYRGPEIPASEWESLTFTTYASDPFTYFAPITSATGELELKPFGQDGKCDLDGKWTPNAEKCPTIVRWLESIGARFGKVALLRMKPNTTDSSLVVRV